MQKAPPTLLDRRSFLVLKSGGGGSRTRVRRTVNSDLYVRRVLLISLRAVSTPPTQSQSHQFSRPHPSDLGEGPARLIVIQQEPPRAGNSGDGSSVKL